MTDSAAATSDAAQARLATPARIRPTTAPHTPPHSQPGADPPPPALSQSPYRVRSAAQQVLQCQELLLLVLSFLSPYELRQASVVVCGCWHAMAARLIWRHLRLRNFRGYLTLLELATLVQRRPAYGLYVRGLSLTYLNIQKGIRDDFHLDVPLAVMFRYCTNLRSLHVDVRIPRLLTQETLLRAVSTQHGLSSFAASNPSPAVLAALAQCAPRLQQLKLSGDTITDAHLEPIAQLRCLRTVVFSNMPLVSSVSVAAILRNSPDVDRMHLDSVLLTEPSFHALRDPRPDLRLRCLSLVLSEDSLGSSQALAALLSAAPRLEELYIINVEAEDLISIAPQLERIRRLEITAGTLTPVVCDALGTHLRSIRFLILSRCKMLSDASLAGITRNVCNTLWDLKVIGGPLLTDAGIRTAGEHMGSLRWIFLQDCQWLTDMSIMALTTYCPQVEWLRLQSPNFTLELLWQVLGRFSRLRWFIIDDLFPLDTSELDKLEQHNRHVWLAAKTGSMILRKEMEEKAVPMGLV
ncbi:hypothetical protein RI367_000763 [Sorochytrium milnesiophthora]